MQRSWISIVFEKETININMMNIRQYIITGILASIIFWSTGCRKPFGIEGNGQVVSETRQMVSFNRVVNEGVFNVFIQQDSIFEVTVEAESNLIPHIRTLVNGNTLIIDTRENLKNYYPMNIYVRTPFIDGVYLAGSGFIHLDSLDTDNLEVDISGSGRITGEVTSNYLRTNISGSGSIALYAVSSSTDTKISGSGDIELIGESFSGTHTISGSGNVRAYSFYQNEVIAKISGSGNMYLNVSEILDVTISGSGSVFYLGDPLLTVKITGSGTVIKQ